MKNKKKSILFINQSSGYLMLDICNAFVESRKYDTVALQTGDSYIRPTRPHPELKVIKSKRYIKKNIYFRFISWTISFVHSLILIWFRFPKAKLFLVSNPPFNIFLPLFCKNNYFILIFDIYPDILIGQKFLNEKSFIVRFWNKVNRKVMKKAHNVYTITEDMRNVLSQYVSKNKIEVINIWTHGEVFRPIDKKKNPFLLSLKLEEKFIVQYSGNMGYTHDIEILVDVAAKLKNRSDIVFLFIGEGMKKQLIKDTIAKFGLHNCYVLPFQSSDMLPYSMGSADIGIITLDSNSASLSIPSKAFTYMAMGAVLLCITPKGSPLDNMVNINLLGGSFEKTQINEIGNYIISLVDNKEKTNVLKKNSLQLSKKFLPSNAYKYVQ